MAFILRQRSELLPHDEARLREAGDIIARLEAALRAPAQDVGADKVAKAAHDDLRSVSAECRSELEDARWRLLKGDTLGADIRLEHAVGLAREGLRSLQS